MELLCTRTSDFLLFSFWALLARKRGPSEDSNWVLWHGTFLFLAFFFFLFSFNESGLWVQPACLGIWAFILMELDSVFLYWGIPLSLWFVISERKVKVKVAQLCSTLCKPMDCSPWNSPGQNTGVGSLFLLQRMFPSQGSNSGLPHCRKILYQLSHKGSSILW